MKLKLKIIFLFILTLVLIPGFVWILLTGKTAHAIAPSTADAVMYDESLSNNWQNWSWNTKIDFSSSENPQSGAKTIAATMSGWGGLYFHTDTAVDPASSESFIFSLRPTQEGTNFVVLLYDENNQPITTPQPLTNFGEAPGANLWKSYVVPFPADRQVKGIAIQDVTGRNDNRVFFDDIFVKNKPGVAPSPMAVPSQVLGAATTTNTPAPAVQSTKRFITLSPGSALPSGEECAGLVRRSPWEPRPENNQANNTRGMQLTTRIDGANAEGNQRFLSRINGSFTGTTDEIIQWGACKWGFDEDIVRAVAAQESWWRQSTQGDWNGSNFESYGLLQVRRTYHEGTYPTSVNSVPFNVDYALAWRRACYEGYFNWIPAEAKGDEWGCVGLWFSGRWKDGDPNVDHSGANWYIARVQNFLNEKPWLKPDF